MILFFRKYAFSWLIAALIFYLCVRSSVPSLLEVVRNNEVCVETEDFSLSYVQLRDILGHMFFYVLLSFSVAWESFRTGVPFRSWRMFFLSVIIPCLYGGVLELVQQFFFPPRSAEWIDWLDDCLGAFMGWLLASVFVSKLDCLINTK